MTLDCHETKIRNISGSRKNFSFLPPHGFQMDDLEEKSFPGDLRATLQAQDRYGRDLAALLRALDRRDLALVSTPSQHYFDTTADRTRVIGIAAAVPVVLDPCTGIYSSSLDLTH